MGFGQVRAHADSRVELCPRLLPFAFIPQNARELQAGSDEFRVALHRLGVALGRLGDVTPLPQHLSERFEDFGMARLFVSQFLGQREGWIGTSESQFKPHEGQPPRDAARRGGDTRFQLWPGIDETVELEQRAAAQEMHLGATGGSVRELRQRGFGAVVENGHARASNPQGWPAVALEMWQLVSCAIELSHAQIRRTELIREDRIAFGAHLDGVVERCHRTSAVSSFELNPSQDEIGPGNLIGRGVRLELARADGNERLLRFAGLAAVA
jgi:hypothetical protein